MTLLSYAALKAIHVSAVTISGVGFAARGWGALRSQAWVRSRPARTLPHLIDTVLLLSALGMLWLLRLAPWALPWLRAKLVGLVCYIAVGVLALRSLRRARSPPDSVAGAPDTPRHSLGLPFALWVAALLLFGYIVSVALTKNPLGLFSL